MILDRIHEVFHQRKVAKLRAEIAAKQRESTKLQQENDELRAESVELRRRIAEKEEIIKNRPPQDEPET